MRPLAPATASVAAKLPQSIGGNQTMAGAAADAPAHSHPTSDAASATITTRRYCMNATRRASAPNSPDISIITEAPPGATPHTAVVPGSTFSLAIIQPRAALVAMIAATTARNSGQFLKKVMMMSPVMERATNRPTMVCATDTGRRGTRIRPPFVASRMPASIGPSSRAAGSATSSRSAASMTEPAIRIAHCAGTARLAMAPEVCGSGGRRVMMGGLPSPTGCADQLVSCRPGMTKASGRLSQAAPLSRPTS